MKNEEKIYPAPWTLDETVFPLRIISADGHIVCGDILPSGLGNARLIARAPQMLDELRILRLEAKYSKQYEKREKEGLYNTYKSMKINLEHVLRNINRLLKDFDDEDKQD
jgi:hypothetical protein